MKIIICDDEPKDSERTRQLLLEKEIATEEQITVYKPQELALVLELEEFVCDIAIMDIEYKRMEVNGIMLSMELNRRLPTCQIIYLTNVLEFAPEVYETKHCYFVLKAHMDWILPRAMQKAIYVLQNQERFEVLELRENGKSVYIRQRDILYLERIGRAVVIHTLERDYSSYQSLSQLLRRLDMNFLRCHGSYAVNYRYIRSLMRESVKLEGDIRIPIGRSYRTSFHERYMVCIGQHV